METYVDLMHAFTNLLKDAPLPIDIHEELIPMTGRVRLYETNIAIVKKLQICLKITFLGPNHLKVN